MNSPEPTKLISQSCFMDMLYEPAFKSNSEIQTKKSLKVSHNFQSINHTLNHLQIRSQKLNYHEVARQVSILKEKFNQLKDQLVEGKKNKNHYESTRQKSNENENIHSSNKENFTITDFCTIDEEQAIKKINKFQVEEEQRQTSPIIELDELDFDLKCEQQITFQSVYHKKNQIQSRPYFSPIQQRSAEQQTTLKKVKKQTREISKKMIDFDILKLERKYRKNSKKYNYMQQYYEMECNGVGHKKGEKTGK